MTKAASRLQLSQPTMSESLRRLRVHYDDELLSRRGNSYVLTPLAERLTPQLSELLSSVSRVLDVRLAYDPLHTERVFSLVASDAHQVTFGRTLAELLAREAPRSVLRLHHSTEQFIAQPDVSLRGVDALMLPQELLSGMPHIDLYSDAWVCVVADDGPYGEQLTLDEMRHAAWVLPYVRSSTASSLHAQFRSAGIRPHAAIVIENFVTLPALIAGSERIGIGPRRALETMHGSGIRTAHSPFDLGTVMESLWWHPMHERDAGHIWFRSAVARAAREATREATD